MTTPALTDHEWEILSAYLDGQLPPGERSRVESLLNSRDDLRLALADLRTLRSFLRSEGRLRAPRNFTLNAQTAGVRRQARLFPSLSLASALASVMFVVVLLGDLLVVNRALPAIPLAQEAAPAAALMQEAAPVQESARSADPGEGTPTPEIESLAASVPGTPTPEAPPPEEPAPSAKMAPAEPVTGTADLAAGSELAVESAPAAGTAPADTGDAAPANTRLWRIAEALLAALALITGLAAFFLRRTGQA